MVLYGKVASKGTLDKSMAPDTPKRYGLGWPIGADPNVNEPYFKKVSSNHLIRSQIRQLVKTRKGERPMLPYFGLDLEKYLFNPLTSNTSAKMVKEIQEAMASYAPNVKLLRAKVFQDDNINGLGMPGLMIILIVSSVTENTPIQVDLVI